MVAMTKDDSPEALKPYLFHGLDLNAVGKEATTDCPFCGREGKLSINSGSGVFRCLTCNEKGNAHVFIRRLFEESMKATYETRRYDSLLSALLEERGILEERTAKAWGLCRSILTPHWMLAGYGIDGKLNQLYRYVNIPGRKFMWLPTPTLGHQLHGVFPLSRKAETIHVCEGPFDGMIWWETLGHAAPASEAEQEDGHRFNYVPDAKRSVRSNGVAVVAVPGCGTFLPNWVEAFSGRDTVILFDSDHPRVNEKTGKTEPPAGFEGVKRVAGILGESDKPPRSVRYLRWGEGGYDPELESGTDVRDILKVDSDTSERVRTLSLLLAHVADLYEGEAVAKWDDTQLATLACTSYKELIQNWRKAIKWTDGLDIALSAMLAAIMSTKQVGDQLWLKIMSPPSTGKTTLAEGLAVAKQFVKATDTVRGFTSGYKLPDGSTHDLATLINGMTLITIDGDTLLQLPNLPNVLSEARRLYDGSLNSHFKNGMGKDVGGHRMTWLLCGTASLRQLDSSELGARFLDCVIMDGIDAELENEIVTRATHAAFRNVLKTADKSAETQQSEEVTRARQITGGYVEYLRKNAGDLLSTVDVNDQTIENVGQLAKFIAYMRARPSSRQDETAEREMATRLAGQLARLSVCLSVVLNRSSVDTEVLRRVRKIALDTARGYTLDICRIIHEEGEEGAEPRAIAVLISSPETEVKKLLRFLKRIQVLDVRTFSGKGVSRTQKWFLTEPFRELWESVFVPLET